MKAIFTGTEQDLIECEFWLQISGVYGVKDYVPQKWYNYYFSYRHKAYKVQTNIVDYLSNDKFTSLYLLKEKKKKHCLDWKMCENWKIFHKWLNKCKKKNYKPLIQDLIDKNLVRFEKE